MTEKLTFNEKIKELFCKAVEESDYSEIKRLYQGVMAPVKSSDYDDESKYLEDLEWDIEAKRDMLNFLTSAVPMETLLISLK